MILVSAQVLLVLTLDLGLTIVVKHVNTSTYCSSVFLNSFAIFSINELSAGGYIAGYHINTVPTLLQTHIGMTALCIACALLWLNPEF